MFKKFKYLLKCIVHMKYKKFFKSIGIIHELCGKNRIFLFLDIIICGFQYGAGYNDYLLYEFYSLTKKQRKTYLTRGINNYIAKTLNNSNYYHFFNNKNEFYQRYKKFVGRSWLYLEESTKEDFILFMEDKDVIIIKPTNEKCGVGVEKLKKSEFVSLEKMYEYITKKPLMLVEEVVVQHEDINKINPWSVNTLRIGTIYSEGQVNVVYAFIRIGTGKNPIDNINAGGMCAPIDIKSGVITHVAYDKKRKIYTHHPNTGCQIKDTKIPMWQECLQLIDEVGKILPEIGYVGWDIALTPTKPIIIEGNSLPGHDILQLPPHTPDKIGSLPKFTRYLKNIK